MKTKKTAERPKARKAASPRVTARSKAASSRSSKKAGLVKSFTAERSKKTKTVRLNAAKAGTSRKTNALPLKVLSKRTVRKSQQAQKSPAPVKGSNVIWKFLEMKEQRRKALGEQKNGLHNKRVERQAAVLERIHGLSRYSGPRRRAS